MREKLFQDLPKLCQKKGIAFVGSTLPASLLEKQVQIGVIQKIYVSSAKFLESYEYLVRKVDKDIEVIQVDASAGFRGLLDYIKLIKDIKSKKLHVYIYHECCWPLLDLAVLIVKPKGTFAPQSKIDFMFRPVTFLQHFYQKKNFFAAFKQCLLTTIFKYYYATNDDLSGDLIVPVVRYYPKSISSLSNIQLSQNFTSIKLHSGSEMLILCGSDCASSAELKVLYNSIIDRALKNDFKVSIKDHPNEDARLNLQRSDVQIIPPKIPCELLEDKYAMIIGTASAAMIGFGSRSVSVINLLKSMNTLDKTQRINYISSLNEAVKFPTSVGEIFEN